MHSGVDLYEQLKRQRKRRELESEGFLDKVKFMLFEEVTKDLDTRERIKENQAVLRYPSKEGLDEKRIFTQKDVRSVCIAYHLRFLHSTFFKNDFPPSVLRKIRQFEKIARTPVNYYIMAPAKAFTLKNKDSDPVLFAKVGDDDFYFIDKWGKELHVVRKIVMYPIRSIAHLLLTILGASAVFSAIIPDHTLVLAGQTESYPYRFILFVTLFFCLCAILSFGLLTFHKNFSNSLWNSKFLP